jgi:predicted phage terminase large subunit-like protein
MPQSVQPKPTPEDFAFSRLLSYAAYQYPDYQIGRHHRLIANALERVERGECKRLMIAMPPRHGKSMLASEFFPAWYLGRNPEKYVIATTYAQEFADDIGRKVRNQLSDPVFGAIFPGVSARSDSTSARRFHTTKGGVYFAVGAGGPITGRGAHLLLIDDPIKGREDADSETMRRKLKDWYSSVAYTRLMPGAAVVVIQTRWHEDDLAGWLLAEHAHEGWEVLELPAIDADGNALWPESYPVERLRQIERTIGQRDFSALYQQRPAPADGCLFKPEMIGVVDALPSGIRMCRGWDFAATEQVGTNNPDWTVGAKLGRGPDGVFYICDIVRLRGTPLAVESALVNTASLDGREVAISIPQDPGQAGKSQALYFVQRLAGHAVTASPETGDKSTRAAPFASQIEAGNVRMLRGPWNRDLLDEMRMFPNGAKDDQIDACSRAFAKLLDGAAPARSVNLSFMAR